MSFGINAEEACRNFVGPDSAVVPVAWHLAFAGTGHAMRVDSQEPALEVTSGTTQAA